MSAQEPGKKRKTPRQARARATVEAILMAAAHLLRTEGRARTTTNRIAERAGVSIGSLYQYFPNKEAIWEELREGHDAYFASEVRERIDRSRGHGFRRGVRRMVEQTVALHAADGDLHREVYADDLALARAQEVDYRAYLRQYFEEHAAELRPMPDPELSAYLIVRAMVSLVHGVAAREPERLRHPHYASEVTELLLRFCGAPEDD